MAVLFITLKKIEIIQILSVGERINEWWHNYTMECYAADKMNRLLLYLSKHVNTIMQSEIKQVMEHHNNMKCCMDVNFSNYTI